MFIGLQHLDINNCRDLRTQKDWIQKESLWVWAIQPNVKICWIVGCKFWSSMATTMWPLQLNMLSSVCYDHTSHTLQGKKQKFNKILSNMSSSVQHWLKWNMKGQNYWDTFLSTSINVATGYLYRTQNTTMIVQLPRRTLWGSSCPLQ